MEDLDSLWAYEEGLDELKHKLLCTKFELESLKMDASEEIRKKEENLKQLVGLVQTAYQERDEARDQLNKLINKLWPSKKVNSSITESNSLSETYNHYSLVSGSSPVNSVTSPDFSNISLPDHTNFSISNQPFLQDFNGSMSTKIDPVSAVIDNLVEGKTLPQKGKLLQAVIEAGPLLNTLFLAGPLPRWRNPPLLQQFKMKPFENKPLLFSNYAANRPVNSSSYGDMIRGSSQLCSSSLLNFPNRSETSFHYSGQILSSVGGVNDQIPSIKRQRFH